MSKISNNTGILSDIEIQNLLDNEIIISSSKIDNEQVQPASFDLSLGNKAWRVKSSFLPGTKNKVTDKISRLAMHEIDLTNGAVLEKGCVYIAEISEFLNKSVQLVLLYMLILRGAPTLCCI